MLNSQQFNSAYEKKLWTEFFGTLNEATKLETYLETKRSERKLENNY